MVPPNDPSKHRSTDRNYGLAAGLRSLLFPTSCTACGDDIPSGVLCDHCARTIKALPIVGRISELPFYAEAEFGLEIAAIVIAAKESNDKSARRYLALMMALSLRRALERLQVLESPGGLERSPNIPLKIILFPFPSRPRANRVRGYRHSELLAAEMAREVRRMNLECEFGICPGLELSRDIADQRGLTKLEREANLEGAIRLSRTGLRQLQKLIQPGGAALNPEPPRNKQGPLLVLIDDVMTSGATVSAGATALRNAGFTPDMAILGCVSPRLIYA